MKFVRLSTSHNPANRLQTHVLAKIKPFNGLLLENPQELREKLDHIVQFSNQTYRRCSSLHLLANRDFSTKQVTAFYVNGLFTLTLDEVRGRFAGGTIQEAAPTEADPQTAALPAARNAPEPEVNVISETFKDFDDEEDTDDQPIEPAPEPEPVTEQKPRQAVWESRDSQNVVKYIEWDKFTETVQRLLQEGQIWAMYEDVLGRIHAERFGGAVFPVYLNE